jgi:anti-anti-sigma factor
VTRDDRTAVFARTSDGITTVTLERIFGVECGDALHRTVVDLLEDGQRAFIIDLARVTRVDAAAVGELARAFTTVSANGGGLVLVVGCAQIRRLLDLTRLTTFVPVFPSIAEASARLAPIASC